jgi:hypothetical protein
MFTIIFDTVAVVALPLYISTDTTLPSSDLKDTEYLVKVPVSVIV